jgi:hypothetical protein
MDLRLSRGSRTEAPSRTFDHLPHVPLQAWLDTGLQDAAELTPLLLPFPSDGMRAYPVGVLVNRPRNDWPD